MENHSPTPIESNYTSGDADEQMIQTLHDFLHGDEQASLEPDSNGQQEEFFLDALVTTQENGEVEGNFMQCHIPGFEEFVSTPASTLVRDDLMDNCQWEATKTILLSIENMIRETARAQKYLCAGEFEKLSNETEHAFRMHTQWQAAMAQMARRAQEETLQLQREIKDMKHLLQHITRRKE
ncbi:hypothetical protein EG329_003772 [Mollisiaceae sp. DMI_Dod_QoI]|nr:hypothetical protein EG329_003772 [Helotiales sp. DMI_Dod_QoI]